MEGSDFQRAKPLLLLTYLALEGPKERVFLARLFWPRLDTDLDNLTTTLGRLKRVIPNYLDINYTYVRTSIACDVQALERAFQLEDWEQVISLYKGPFLAGLSLDKHNVELEEWLYNTRESLAHKVRTAYLQLARHQASLSHFEKASHYALKAYALTDAPALQPDELDLLYQLLRASGHPKAHQVSQEAQELGLILYHSKHEAQQVLRLPKVRKIALPVQTTLFIGRTEEKQQLAQYLLQYRLITLIGPGGIGKTRLSLAVAEDQQQHFPDGVYFVALDIVSSPDQIIFALADTLGLHLLGQQPQEQVLAYLKYKRMLLIFDNFEHLTDDLSLIRALLAGAADLKIIVTSRERLGLQSEFLFDVGGLKLPEAQLEVTEALELFAERAQQQVAFHLEEALPVVSTICRLLEGMPLAIELAASWLRVLSPSELLDELKAGLEILSTTLKDLPARHYSIARVFEASWERLSNQEQQELIKLSVFRGGFNKEAARDITGVNIRMLLTFVNKSFLRQDGPGRFSQHPLIFYYLQEKMKARPDDLNALEEKHSLYYLRHLKHHLRHLRDYKARETRASLEADAANLRAAWLWLSRHRLEAIPEYALAMSHLLDSYHDHEALELFQHTANLLDASQVADQIALGYMLVLQSHHAINLGKHATVLLDLAQKGLALLRPHQQASGILIGEMTLGFVARQQGDFEKSVEIFSRALAYARKCGHPQEIAHCLNWLCSSKTFTDDLDSLTLFMRESLKELRQLGDLFRLAYGLYIFGAHLARHGQLDEAEIPLRESLELEQQIQFFSIPIELELAYIAVQRHQLNKAEQLLIAATQKASRIGDDFSQQRIHNLLGKIRLEQGHFDEAAQLLALSLKQNWTMEWYMSLSTSLLYIAVLAYKLGHIDYAIRLLLFLDHYSMVGKQVRTEARELLQKYLKGQAASKQKALEGEAKTLRLEQIVNQILHADRATMFPPFIRE